MNKLMTGVRLTKRGFFATMILFFTYITWYYVFYLFVLRDVAGSSDETYMMAGAAFNFIIVITLLFVSFFIHKLNKLHIIYEASIVTSLVTFLLLFTQSDISGLIFIFIAGIFFSIGQLVFFTFFWDLTATEERGRVAALIGFFSLPFFYFIHFLIPETLNFSGKVILIILLGLGPLVVKLLGPEKTMLTKKKNESGSYPEKRNILLYLIPWILFSLINATFARNISLGILQQVTPSFYLFLTVLQVIAAVFGALGGGMIADFFGRRLSLAFSLTLYGIGSALTGFVQSYVIFSFVYVANGLTWGILLIMYSMVVWGDLSNKGSCAKMYSIGLIVFYLTTGIGILLAPQISQIPLVVSSLVTCGLMFFSNLPLILAPELLSSDIREKIRLKRYVDALRKTNSQG